MNNIHDVAWDIQEEQDAINIIRAQEIPEDFMGWLRAEREASKHEKMGEIATLASIPAVLVVQWLNEGFDVFREPAREIIKRLKAQGFDGFLATDKRI